jgi:hypothetical protein
MPRPIRTGASFPCVRDVHFGSEADTCSAQGYVRFGPIADITICLVRPTAGERGVLLRACVLRRWLHSTGSDCKSLYITISSCLCSDPSVSRQSHCLRGIRPRIAPTDCRMTNRARSASCCGLTAFENRS